MVPGSSRGKQIGYTYEAMKFMVDVESADIAIIFGYSNTNFLTTKALHHFRFDPNIFI